MGLRGGLFISSAFIQWTYWSEFGRRGWGGGGRLTSAPGLGAPGGSTATLRDSSVVPGSTPGSTPPWREVTSLSGNNLVTEKCLWLITQNENIYLYKTVINTFIGTKGFLSKSRQLCTQDNWKVITISTHDRWKVLCNKYFTNQNFAQYDMQESYDF